MVSRFLWAEVVVLSTHEQPPLSYTAPDGQIRGEAVDPVRRTLETLGRPFRIQVRPWERAQLEGTTGVTSGFFAASRNEARDAACTPSSPVAWQVQLWYVRKDAAFTPQQAEFPTRLRFGGYQGANMTEFLRRNNFNLIVTPPNLEALILALQLGRIDVFLGNQETVEATMRRMKVPRGFFLTYPQSRRPLVVYFHKGFLDRNPGFLEKFNQGLEENLRKSLSP